MNIFSITAVTDPDKLGVFIAQCDKADFYQITQSQWLAAFNGTTRELFALLSINGEDLGSVVVLHVSNYWGYADRDVWEWLALKEKT